MQCRRCLKAGFWRGRRIRRRRKKRKKLTEKPNKRRGGLLIERRHAEDGEVEEELGEAVWLVVGSRQAPEEAGKGRVHTRTLQERAHIGAVHTQMCCHRGRQEEEIARGAQADTLTNELEGARPEEEGQQERHPATSGRSNNGTELGTIRHNGGERKRSRMRTTMKEADPLWMTTTSLWEDGLRDQQQAGEQPAIPIWGPESQLQ